jgi:hypothetical protein
MTIRLARLFGLMGGRTLTAISPAIMACGALLFGAPARACTVFALTDTNQALLCDNEDWSNPRTRIWFLPAGEGYYGAVYVGFNNGWAQGGMNTEGLAFGWVAGYQEKWDPDSNLPDEPGNPSERMLETCATVNDAISFYRHHQEPGFSYAQLLVADKTGACVIFSAKDGKLQVERGNQSCGFGFGWSALGDPLKEHPKPTVANGFKILCACRQPGQYATKYSHIDDLKSGDIYLYPIPNSDDEVTFNLAAELKKGGHYYDMSTIHEEMAQAPRPLLPVMMRYFPNNAVTNNAPAPVPPLDPQICDRYVGQYHFHFLEPGPAGRKLTPAKSFDISVSLAADKNHLVASVRGLQEFPLEDGDDDYFPVTTNSFVVNPDLTGDYIQLTFLGLIDGKATRVAVNWNGKIFSGTRTAAVTDSANAGAEPDIQGAWEGTGGESPESPVVLRIVRVNGAYQANLADLGWGTKRQFDTFTYRYPYLHGGPVESDGSFVGIVDLSGENISIMQYDQTRTITLRRTTHPTPFPEPLTDAEFTPRAGSDLQGFWAGTVDAGKTTVHIQIKIAEASNGTYRADLYGPGPGGEDRFPVTVNYNGTTVKLMPMAGYGMFEGRLRNGGKEMDGDWIQEGRHMPTTLTQANYSEYKLQAAK